MADKFTTEKRSQIMAQVKGQNTKPEKKVRSLLHLMGYRFRLHRKDLPGKPDIVLLKYKKVIFVHGCFWHGHPDCRRSARPTSNRDFWDKKIDGNIKRDMRTSESLAERGWCVLTVWECETRDLAKLQDRLKELLGNKVKEEE
jgi:DNA mismatch endonuclease (patch repair protein)